VTTKICSHQKANGQPCKAPSMEESEFCFFHSPSQTEARRQARSLGGSKNSSVVLPPTLQQVQVKSANDILTLMTETIHHVRTGQLDPRIANCIGYLSLVNIQKFIINTKNSPLLTNARIAFTISGILFSFKSSRLCLVVFKTD